MKEYVQWLKVGILKSAGNLTLCCDEKINITCLLFVPSLKETENSTLYVRDEDSYEAFSK